MYSSSKFAHQTVCVSLSFFFFLHASRRLCWALTLLLFASSALLTSGEALIACSLLFNLIFASCMAASACFLRWTVDAGLMRGICTHMVSITVHLSCLPGSRGCSAAWAVVTAYTGWSNSTHLCRELIYPFNLPVIDGQQAIDSARILCLYAPQLLRSMAVTALVVGCCLRSFVVTQLTQRTKV